jgi:hypothetical protein
MRTRWIVGVAAVMLLSLMARPAAAVYPLQSDVICPEGIFVGGAEVTDGQLWDDGTLSVDGALDVTLDWSDNILYHQFPAGAKVRLETILYTTGADGQPDRYVYTLSAHFKIEGQVVDDEGNPVFDDEGNPLWDALFESSIGEGLWLEGVENRDSYTAEINLPGILLYGYNWDTRGQDPGKYKISFWIGDIVFGEDLPPDDVTIIEGNTVDITKGSVSDAEAPPGYATVGYSSDYQESWVIIDLQPKDHGRK